MNVDGIFSIDELLGRIKVECAADSVYAEIDTALRQLYRDLQQAIDANDAVAVDIYYTTGTAVIEKTLSNAGELVFHVTDDLNPGMLLLLDPDGEKITGWRWRDPSEAWEKPNNLPKPN